MPAVDFKALKLLVSMADVLQLIGWRPSEVQGRERRGPCPIHCSTSPASRSFAVSPEGFYCHSCKENGDQLRLYAQVRRLPIYEAATQLAELLVFPMPYLARPRRVRKPRNSEEER